MKITDEYEIQQILFKRHNKLAKLCLFSKQLLNADEILKKFIILYHPSLSDNFKVAGLTNNCLMIETNRSEYLTLLKYETTELLSFIRSHSGFSSVVTIKYKVSPIMQNKLNVNSFKASQNKLSENTKNNLKDLANSLHNEQLKQALLKLAE